MSNNNINSLEELMASDANDQLDLQLGHDLPDTSKLTELSKLVAMHELLASEASNLENKLKSVNNKLRQLNEVDIPELFNEMGNIEQIKMADGRSVSIKDDIAVSIKKDALSEQVCFDFLEHNKLASIIKSQFNLTYGKDEQSKVDATRDLLLENGCDFNEKRAVHPQTLKSSVKGLLEQGKQIPDSFNFYPYRKTVIK